jgi:hypothetical protein
MQYPGIQPVAYNDDQINIGNTLLAEGKVHVTIVAQCYELG